MSYNNNHRNNNQNLIVENNLISVRKYNNCKTYLELYYEIALTNQTNEKISHVQITDNFFDNLGTICGYTLDVCLTSKYGNLVPLSSIDVNCGLLLQECDSYINANDTAVLILKIVIQTSNESNSESALYNYIVNSVVVTGKGRHYRTIQPVYATSDSYTVE